MANFTPVARCLAAPLMASERRREISQKGRKIFAFSERSLKHNGVGPLFVVMPVFPVKFWNGDFHMYMSMAKYRWNH